jgi:hypothetical protein
MSGCWQQRSHGRWWWRRWRRRQQGGGTALALLGSHWGHATEALACAVCLQPRAAGGGQQHLLCLACVGVGPLVRWLALRARGPGRRWGGGSGIRGRIRRHLRRQQCRKGGEQRRLLSSACVGVGPLMYQLALRPRGPWRRLRGDCGSCLRRWQGGGGGGRFAWLALGLGR